MTDEWNGTDGSAHVQAIGLAHANRIWIEQRERERRIDAITVTSLLIAAALSVVAPVIYIVF